MKKKIRKKFVICLAKSLRKLALRAVESSESIFGRGKGIAKKRFAMNFILARLNVPSFVREYFSLILVDAVDLAVEYALLEAKGLLGGGH